MSTFSVIDSENHIMETFNTLEEAQKELADCEQCERDIGEHEKYRIIENKTSIIKIRVKEVYGKQTIYPACEKSALLCKLTGKKTFD